MLLLQSFLVWLVILGLAVANAALREAVLIPYLSKSVGLTLSGVLLCLLILLIAYGFVRLNKGFPVQQALAIGVLWLVLTLAFEFSFGRYVQDKSWAELVEAYTFKEGNIWPVVLVVTFLAPSIATWFHTKSGA